MNGEEAVATNDKVCIRVALLGLLWHNFHDTTREADGKRILRIWENSSGGVQIVKSCKRSTVPFSTVLLPCHFSKQVLIWQIEKNHLFES